MDSASSSKIPHNLDQSKEEIINEETMQGQEDISDVERLHQRILEMQQEIIELLKKEGQRKESSFTAENSPMEETTSMPRIFTITIFKAHGLIKSIHFTKTQYSTKAGKYSCTGFKPIATRNPMKQYTHFQDQTKGL
ncbi:hypothetical protein O181_090872 [Austropuccinia psidii MF-1]|uniref:Uncharacterized protein n=1 Tax=Austropuccinia psidii MF-1 TaxID=1389203 RepID=A0A9Q3IW70_9BASI|nr:hypothetical protein [Austropuccinia psidii MF-1]